MIVGLLMSCKYYNMTLCMYNSSYMALNWGALDAWLSAPQLMSCNWFIGSWPLFITVLLYDDPPPSCSQQIAYKNLGCQATTNKYAVCVCVCVCVSEWVYVSQCARVCVRACVFVYLKTEIQLNWQQSKLKSWFKQPCRLSFKNIMMVLHTYICM